MKTETAHPFLFVFKVKDLQLASSRLCCRDPSFFKHEFLCINELVSRTWRKKL